jgi:hypothetical protein
MILAKSMIMSGEATPCFETHQWFSNYLKGTTLRGKAAWEISIL